MKTFWDRNVRPAIIVGSIVIFVFFMHGLDSRGYQAQKPYFANLRPNLQQKVLDISGHRNGARISRHLLGVPNGVSGTKEDSMVMKEEQNGTTPVEKVPMVTSPCGDPKLHVGYSSSCSYVKAVPECRSGTLIEYTQFFYCVCRGNPVLAYSALVLWLFCLFYMLGNTAADFFCSSIEKLSKLLHLPPTVAGVTLLPLGNGAPDVFASIAAFVGTSGQGQVGLNSVLGGATFVSSVVAGSVSLVVAMAGAPVQLDLRCFLRDIGFFLLTLAALTTILFIGKISFWGSIGYISIYGLYAITVAAVEFFKSHRHKLTQWHALQPLLQGQPRDRGNPFSLNDDDFGYDVEIDNSRGVSSAVENALPQWVWAPHVAIYSQQSHIDSSLLTPSAESGERRPLWGWSEEQAVEARWYTPRGLFSYFVVPLSIPRRLTIPLMEEVGWSKFYAVCSATFAPCLLAMVWDGKDTGPFGSAWKEYILFGSIGIVLGGLAYFTLREDRPPTRYLFPWVAGGFIMSIVWFYIVANELVAALVALGVVLEIDPAILGLTVLAWGNSIGDLMSNLALVSHGGDAVQIAFSGCYAGPMFNTLMGVGMSFVLSSWRTYPAHFSIPQDETLFITVGFLVTGLLWALYMLPTRRMQPTKSFGVGLLVLYASFLTLRLVNALHVQTWMANTELT